MSGTDNVGKPVLPGSKFLRTEEFPYEVQPTGADGRYIRDRLMPEFWGQFARKAQDYNDNENENHRQLGVRGQFADIWRKIGKLKKALWEGQPLVGEQPREILMDLIAHCFLTITMLDTEKPSSQPGEEADPMVPSCGRIKCVQHTMVPLSTLGDDVSHDLDDVRHTGIHIGHGINQPCTVHCETPRVR